MSLEAGTILGSYQIVSPLGAGGMGEVYRAKDTKLGRDVAIKVLSETIVPTSILLKDGEVVFEGKPDEKKLARFEIEARALASLNHPSIATLFGFEHDEGQSYIVMELVDGKTLEAHLQRGPLKLERTLEVFIQIADGLEAAHKRGIVHCDLKPANVMITKEGAVKILDFGLAHALEQPKDSRPQDFDLSPTLSYSAETAPATGTVAYMSPEQARGQEINKSTDIWSFGCCLFQALCGERPFRAATVSDTLVSILDREPEMEKLPEDIPRRLTELVRRCLAKDVGRRLRDIGDAGLDLREVKERPDASLIEGGRASEMVRGGSRGRSIAAAIGLLAIGAAGTLLVVRTGGEGGAAEPRGVRRFSINLPAAHPLQPSLPVSPHHGLVLSSDGSLLVYVGQSDDTTMLFRRPMDRIDIEPIEGTEGAWYPFFSPDERWIGYFDRREQKLKKVSLQGGVPEILADAVQPLGASWGADGYIVYSPAASLGLMRISETGGTPEPLSPLGEDELYRGFPSHLPGQDAVLVMFGAYVGAAQTRVGLVDLTTGDLTELIEPAGGAKYVATGHIVYTQLGQLMAAPFDLSSLSLTGPAVRITEPSMSVGERGTWEWDVSAEGTFVFATSGQGVGGGRAAMWVSRDGTERDLEQMLPVAGTDWARLSPDGKQVVYGSLDQVGNWDIYLYELESDTNRRLTFHREIDYFPIFHPDGQRILFASRREGGVKVFELTLAGGEPKLWAEEPRGFPSSLSPDAETLFFDSTGQQETRADIWSFSRGDGELKALVQTMAIERFPSLSPDGQWLAYESHEGGQAEIYVKPYPALDGNYQISTDGGNFPVWSSDGREIFYREGRSLVAATIGTDGGFAVEAREVLFESSSFDVLNYSMDVAPDGQHFLMLRPSVGTENELVVVENWFQELERQLSNG